MRNVLLTLTTSIVLLAASTANASPGITGYSGKPYNGVTDTCKTTCHVPTGTAPTVDVTVPTALTAGETAQVTIAINGTRARTSMNAALSDGVKATKGQNTDIPFPVETPGEVAAIAPPPNGADGTFKFSFVAPNKNGPITLWVAAMSSNGDGTGGDGVATTMKTITISGATATPDPETDGGGASSTSSSSSSGSTNKRDGGSTSDEEDEGSSGTSKRLTSNNGGDSGCALIPTRQTSSLSGLGGAIVLFALIALRRRSSD